MENYLLLGVMNDGTVKASKVIESEEPNDTDFRTIQGQMSNLLGAGRRKDWFFMTHLVKVQGGNE